MKKKLKTPQNKKTVLILIAGLVAGLITGIIILANTNKSSTVVNSQGETINRNGFNITINNSRVEKIDEPNSGMTLHYVVVDLSIENTSDKSLSFIPVFQTYIRNNDGSTYDMSPLPGIQPIYAGEISPGTTVSGELSYYVPSLENEILFFFDPGWNDSKAVFIKLLQD